MSRSARAQSTCRSFYPHCPEEDKTLDTGSSESAGSVARALATQAEGQTGTNELKISQLRRTPSNMKTDKAWRCTVPSVDSSSGRGRFRGGQKAGRRKWMEAELCQARALPAGLGGSAAVVASQARWGHSTEASAERRAHPCAHYLPHVASSTRSSVRPPTPPSTHCHLPSQPALAHRSIHCFFEPLIHTCLPSVARQPAYHPSAHSLRKTSL